MRILWLNFSRCLFTVSRSLIYIKFSISARVDIRLLIFIQFSCKYPIRPLVCISGLHLIPASLQVYLKILSSIEITLSTNLREISRRDDFDTSSSAEWEISIKKTKKSICDFSNDNFSNIIPLPFNSATFEWKRQSGQWITRKFSFIMNSSNKSCRKLNFSAYWEENSRRTSAGPKDASQYIKSFINRVRKRGDVGAYLWITDKVISNFFSKKIFIILFIHYTLRDVILGIKSILY